MTTKSSGAEARDGSEAGDALGADDARRQLEPAGVATHRPGHPEGRGWEDSPKPHGDKLGASSGTNPASGEPGAGDSPKPHGDKLDGAVKGAAGR
jgi:hypothetical protein